MRFSNDARIKFLTPEKVSRRYTIPSLSRFRTQIGQSRTFLYRTGGPAINATSIPSTGPKTTGHTPYLAEDVLLDEIKMGRSHGHHSLARGRDGISDRGKKTRKQFYTKGFFLLLLFFFFFPNYGREAVKL